MSQTNKAFIEPDVAWVGESPDYAGVVAVINPGTKSQVVLAMNPLAAIALGQQLQRHGEKQIARDKPAAVDVPFEAHCSVIERMRPERLDS
jgi:hypothetical protein